MSKVTITIDTGNAAFYDEYSNGSYDPVPEVVRLLRHLAVDMEMNETVQREFTLVDYNGAHVGKSTYTEDED